MLANTFTGVNGAEPLSELRATPIPTTAYEKRVTWGSSDSNIIRIDTGWYNNQRYQTLTVVGDGAAKLYAYDWNENGKRGECSIYVPKVTVISYSPSDWIASSETMGSNMSIAFNCKGSYVVETPTSVSNFESCWNKANECVIIHTHGSPTGLYDHGEDSTPIIISKNEIDNLPINNRIHFIMMTACETAGGTSNDNVAYWLSKKINPHGIVISNTDVVSGGATSFGGLNNNPTWKVYKNGSIQNPISDVILTMESAYSIYESYK